MAWEGYTCGELLKRVSDIFETNANRDLQSHGVTLSQMKMLAFLDHTEDGSTTLKSLEAHFKVSQATIAGIAARLEKKGLVQGYIDPEDRRVKHIALSPAGRQLCGHTKSAMEQGERLFLEALSPQERATLQQLADVDHDPVVQIGAAYADEQHGAQLAERLRQRRIVLHGGARQRQDIVVDQRLHEQRHAEAGQRGAEQAEYHDQAGELVALENVA